MLRGGTYHEALVVLLQGKPDSPVVVRSYPGEVDGKWYVPAIEKLVAGAFTVRQGDAHERFSAVSLEGKNWVLKSAIKADDNTWEFRKQTMLAHADPKNRLQLTPGKHKIRVRCLGIAPLLKGDRAGPSLRPISNVIEIELAETKE